MDTSATTSTTTSQAAAAAAAANSSSTNTATTDALSNSLTNLEFSDLMQIWGDVNEDSASKAASTSIMSSTTAQKVSGTAAPTSSPLPITSSSVKIHDNHDTRDLSTTQAAREQARYDLQLSSTSAYLRSLGQTMAADSASSLSVTAS